MPALVGCTPRLASALHLNSRPFGLAVLWREEQGCAFSNHLVLGPAKHIFRTVAPLDDLSVEIGSDDREILGAIHDSALPRLRGRYSPHRQALFELCHHLSRQNANGAQLHVGEGSGTMIKHA